MRILALGGAGAVAKEATRDLAEFSAFDEIVIGEMNIAAARALAADIDSDRVAVLEVDARDEARLRSLVAGFDVVMNGLPYQFDLPVERACVAAGVSGLDLSQEDDQFAPGLNAAARERDIVYIPGVGATPGTTNAMARRGIELLEGPDGGTPGRAAEVHIYFAAFRCLAPAPGLLQTTMWEFDPGEPARDECYYANGRMHPAPPFSDLRTVRFHDGIGEQEVMLIPHGEPHTLPRSYPQLRKASVHGCFPPRVMRLFRALLDNGCLSRTPLEGLGGRAPIDVVKDLLWTVPETREHDNWGYGLIVEVVGERAGRPATATLKNAHPPQAEWGGPAAYYKNVGIPLAIGAQMIADGRITARGTVPPELALPPEALFTELARRGITIVEKLETSFGQFP